MVITLIRPLDKAGLLSSQKLIQFFDKIGKFFNGVLHREESIETKDIHHNIPQNGECSIRVVMGGWRDILFELHILHPMTVIFYLPMQADSFQHLLGTGVETSNIPMQFVIFDSFSRTEVVYFHDCCDGVPSQRMNWCECFIARPHSQMPMFFPPTIPLIALCHRSRWDGFCGRVEGLKEFRLIQFDLCKVVISAFYDTAERFFWVCKASSVRI
jgi:hypothetical protein